MRDFQRRQASEKRLSIRHRLSKAALLPATAGTMLLLQVAAPAPASAQAGCGLNGGIRIVHPSPHNSYHFVLPTGHVTCSKGVATTVTESIRRNVSVLPDTTVASRQWKGEHGTGAQQTYELGTDCTQSNKGQKFHGDIYLNWKVGLTTAPTQHIKTNDVTC